MKNLSTQSRFYLVSVYLAGALLLSINLLDFTITDPVIFATLCTLGSILHILKVEGATNRSHYTFSFLIFGFAIIFLPPTLALIVIIVSNVAEWAWNRPPWFIQLFNISCYIISAQIAILVYQYFNAPGTFTSWEVILAIALAMISFTVVNHMLVGIILWLARGENFKQSGIFDMVPISIDLIMLTLGASLVLIWNYNPYALLIFLAPLYPIYISLKIPSLERKTETDQKTGLFNHNYFMEHLKNELNRANRYDRPLSIIMADLDLLRNINNTYGHLAGDEVLKGVADILKHSVREYDVVARFGGEEFAILLPEAETEKAIERAEFIRREIENARFNIPTSVNPIQATLSLGIATRENFEQTGEEIIHNADAALYNSKLKGRNRAFAYAHNTFKLVKPGTAVIQVVDTQPLPRENEAPAHAETEYSASSRQYVARESTGAKHAAQEPVKAEAKQDDTPPDAKPRSSHPKVLLYIAGLAVIAIIFSAFAFSKPLNLNGFLLEKHWIGLVAISLIVISTEWLSIDLYVKNTSLSSTAVPLVAGFILFGPFGVVAISLVYAITAGIKYRSPFNRVVFNLSNHVIAGMTINLLLTPTSVLLSSLGAQLYELLTALLASTVMFLITTSLISIGIGTNLRQSPFQIWSEQYKWMTPYYVGIGLVAYALIFGYKYASEGGLLVMIIPLFILRYSQMQYVEHTRKVVTELRNKNQELEKSTNEINELNEGLLATLSEIIDLRDPYVLGHSKQVSEYSTKIAHQLKLSNRQVGLIHKAGLLHDIGKLGIPMEILTKPSKLTPEEYEIIKSHAALGGELVKNSPSLRQLVPIIRHHHEFYNGEGYPDKLAGNQISIEARIVAVADAIEAMISDRPYRKALKPERIVEELSRNSGSQFDPIVIEAAIKMLKSMNTLEKTATIRTDTQLRVSQQFSTMVPKKI
jgi:diguanylate cyclase (GGDEF)-like protein/putative nucleotidyltransferase with HDIG domain